jgi:hypothetical protein
LHYKAKEATNQEAEQTKMLSYILLGFRSIAITDMFIN